jgi:hypothetical protein
MKRPFIWTDTKKDIHMLWIWRISFMFTTKVEDKRKIGIWKTKRATMIFILKYGIGIGHSFGIENRAYKY